jgi:hypothetical protein
MHFVIIHTSWLMVFIGVMAIYCNTRKYYMSKNAVSFAAHARVSIFFPRCNSPPPPPVGHSLLIVEVFTITLRHTTLGTTPGRMVSPAQRPVSDNTQYSQGTDIHALGGVRTRNPSKREVPDTHLSPRGHRGQHVRTYTWDFHSRTLHLNIIRVFTPTDAQVF